MGLGLALSCLSRHSCHNCSMIHCSVAPAANMTANATREWIFKGVGRGQGWGAAEEWRPGAVGTEGVPGGWEVPGATGATGVQVVGEASWLVAGVGWAAGPDGAGQADGAG